MPRGPKGKRRPADVIGNAVKVMRIVTGEETEEIASVSEAPSGIRIHTTLRVTPAMSAGFSETVMDWAQIIEAMDADTLAKKRRPYKRAAA